MQISKSPDLLGVLQPFVNYSKTLKNVGIATTRKVILDRSNLGGHVMMIAHPNNREHIGHSNLERSIKVEGKGYVNGQLPHVEERRRQGRRQEAKLILHTLPTFIGGGVQCLPLSSATCEKHEGLNG